MRAWTLHFVDPVTPSQTVTHRQVFALAGPAMLANMTTPLIGVIGTAVIGRLGQAHLLGAVAMSALVFDWMFWIFGFLRVGTVALTAQALGAGDGREQRAVVSRALLIALVIGLAFIVLQVPLAELIYGLMGGSPVLLDAAKTYFAVRIWSAPFVLANYAVLGHLIGVARASAALALQVAINVTNVAVTALLVLGLGWGVTGAALGAVVAEVSGFVIGLAAVLWISGRIETAPRIVFDRTKMIRMLVVNRDIMIRTIALLAAVALFIAQGARAGDTILAANAVLNNLAVVGIFFVDGFAIAAEQLCGRYAGARSRPAFERSAQLALGWGFGFGLAATLILIAAGPALIDLVTTSSDVREAARQYLVLAALVPVIGVAAFAYDGIFMGATWTREARDLMLASLAIYIAAWLALRGLGNAGLWGALLIWFGTRGVLQWWRFGGLVQRTFG